MYSLDERRALLLDQDVTEYVRLLRNAFNAVNNNPRDAFSSKQLDMAILITNDHLSEVEAAWATLNGYRHTKIEWYARKGI